MASSWGRLTTCTPRARAGGAASERKGRLSLGLVMAEERADRDISRLTALHASEIAAVQKLLDANEQITAKLPKGWDELHVLRYVLSGRGAKTEAVVEKIRRAGEERAARTWLEHANENFEPPPEYAQAFDKIRKFLIVGIHGFARDGSPLYFIRSGISRVSEAVEICGADHITMFQSFNNACLYRIIDRITRETGKLVKVTMLNDMRGMRLGAMDRAFFKASGAASHLSELFFPQLLERTVAINTPAFMSMVFKVAKTFVSKGLIEKFQMHSGDLHTWQDPATGLSADDVFDFKQLPRFVVGSNCELHDPLEPCIPPVPNEQKTQIEMPILDYYS
ncbi:SEC14-like protein 5 [Porphyridium purpureum]|uniref:SEC14-like protein 5 n=1 Tax=Porphyridium purpureum TaxID=35688 RepID=A0A5J4Z7F7_PORPP|nr:SEC14-like protein 5 [Porphyridium purpureum]|eukprot:POR9326..scf295_1